MLLGVTWSATTAVHAASDTVIIGQGRALISSVHAALQRDGRPASPEQATEILEALRGDGLRYLALSRGSKILTSAGERAFPDEPAAADSAGTAGPVERLTPRLRLERFDGRARLVDSADGNDVGPPAVTANGPTGPGAATPGGPQLPPMNPPVPGGAAQTARPTITIEFEPTVASRLSLHANQTLIAGFVGAIAIFGIAYVLRRQLQAREVMEQRLAQERHLATLGEMSATLAHEIRNPLASAKGHAQLLVALLPGEERARAKAERVVGDIVRLEELISGLLSFVRSGRIKPVPCNPTELLQRAAELAGPGTVEVDVAHAPEAWALDGGRIQQALTNLIENAVQASGQDTVVSARVSARTGSLEFVVDDSGPGLPEGDTDHLFEPFVTTKTRGTGLGLAVARRVARAHGGDLTAANRPEGGATFRMVLPHRPQG